MIIMSALTLLLIRAWNGILTAVPITGLYIFLTICRISQEAKPIRSLSPSLAIRVS